MKRLLPLTLLALLLTAVAYAGLRATRVYVNGLPLRDRAIVEHGVTYVPLRAVAESLGCTVDYDPKHGVLIWGGQQSPNPNATPGLSSGLPTPGLPRDPRPILPQPPTPGGPGVP